MEAKYIILALALKYDNDWQLVYEGIRDRERLSEEYYRRAEEYTGGFLTILDPEYPKKLSTLPHPPFVIFYEGDITKLSQATIEPGDDSLVYLHGPNTLHIPEDRLCVELPDGKLLIGGCLKVWANKNPKTMDRHHLPSGLCPQIVCTNIYRKGASSAFLGLTLTTSLMMNNEIYVVPTTTPSRNNDLIKEGAYLIDDVNDLKNAGTER